MANNPKQLELINDNTQKTGGSHMNMEYDTTFNNIAYKPTVGSFSSPELYNQNLVGVRLLGALSKPMMRTIDSDSMAQFYYLAFRASELGYDYVLLNWRRTNSGRTEAVKFTQKTINLGAKLYGNYKIKDRTVEIRLSVLCRGDVTIPRDPMPKKYDNLKEFQWIERKPVSVPEPEPVYVLKEVEYSCYADMPDHIKALAEAEFSKRLEAEKAECKAQFVDAVTTKLMVLVEDIEHGTL